MTYLLCGTESVCIVSVWNQPIPQPAWIKQAETGFPWQEQKKSQNKHKNNEKVYQLNFFHCIISLSYKVTSFVKVLVKLIIQQKILHGIFCEKVVK